MNPKIANVQFSKRTEETYAKILKTAGRQLYSYKYIYYVLGAYYHIIIL